MLPTAKRYLSNIRLLWGFQQKRFHPLLAEQLHGFLVKGRKSGITIVRHCPSCTCVDAIGKIAALFQHTQTGGDFIRMKHQIFDAQHFSMPATISAAVKR